MSIKNLGGKIVSGRIVQTHTFLYTKDKIKLDFTLATDTQTELVDFKMLLEQALKDVDIKIQEVRDKRDGA